MKLPTATKQAPDAESAAADGDSNAKRKAVSKRNFIGPNDAEVDKIEEATGMQYVLLDPAGNHTFNVQLGEAGKLATMAAVFGLQTKIGNVANTVLNDKDEPGSPTDAAAAIKEWLAQVEGGTWAERTTGGVGARVDKDALAGAILAVAIAGGKFVADSPEAGAAYSKVRDRLENEPQYVRAARQVPDVAREYATRVGKAAKTIDELI